VRVRAVRDRSSELPSAIPGCKGLPSIMRAVPLASGTRRLLLLLLRQAAVAADGGHVDMISGIHTSAGCNTASTKDVDRCPGGPQGYREQQVAAGAGAASECAALCCNDPTCEVWVTRPIEVGAGSCSAGSTCCWTKPACSGTLASPGTTSGTVFRPNKNFSFIDTATWVGTEYTPARAANSLWWASFPDYESDIERELSAANAVLGITVLRIFLHTLAFNHIGPAKHEQFLGRFIGIAESYGMKVGIVLFGDGWNHGWDLPHPGNTGANESCVLEQCCPQAADGTIGVKGCHNGCWYANPQDYQRGDPPANFDGRGGSNVSFIEQTFRSYVC
jgi:hypothetical protein